MAAYPAYFHNAAFAPSAGSNNNNNNNGNNFVNLFRLLDDFDSYSRSGSGTPSGCHRAQGRPVPTFQPRFDIRETDKSYELHGELPGMDKKDLHVEFADDQTLIVRGRIERTYTRGTPHAATAAAIEAEKKPATTTEEATTTEGGGEDDAGEEFEKVPSPSKQHPEHQASVEDEADAEKSESGTPVATPATTAVSLAQQPQQQSKKEVAPARPRDTAKYWATERTVGEFSRTFTFQQRVDQDGVTASLKDGILNISAPKAKKQKGTRVTVA